MISFFTICVIWVSHHGLFWWNAFLLLWVSLIPIPTALMGDYPGDTLAVFSYGVVMALMAAAFFLMRWYVVRNDGILGTGTDKARFRQGTVLSVLFGPVLYLAGAAAVHDPDSQSVKTALQIIPGSSGAPTAEAVAAAEVVFLAVPFGALARG